MLRFQFNCYVYYSKIRNLLQVYQYVIQKNV